MQIIYTERNRLAEQQEWPGGATGRDKQRGIQHAVLLPQPGGLSRAQPAARTVSPGRYAAQPLEQQ